MKTARGLIYGVIFSIPLWILIIATVVYAKDVTMAWDPSDGATGYKIYMSVDNGQTWNAPVDAGDVTEFAYPDVAETGRILFRVSAYNTEGESIRYDAGVWYCGDCAAPPAPTKVGVE